MLTDLARLQLFWCAPEVMRNLPYTEKSDVYSFGIMLWEVLTRESLYPGLHPLSVGYKVTARRPSWWWACADAHGAVLQVMVEDLRPEIPPECPDHLAVLMRQCWHIDAIVRPNFKDLLNTVCGARVCVCVWVWVGAVATAGRPSSLTLVCILPQFEGLASPYLSQFINNLKEFQEMQRKAKHQQEVRLPPLRRPLIVAPCMPGLAAHPTAVVALYVDHSKRTRRRHLT
jgi:serine/threonine protein kinase